MHVRMGISTFNNVLNESTDFAVFTYSGSLFHKRGAAHRKERAPQDFVNRGSVKRILLFERNCLCCLYGVKQNINEIQILKTHYKFT